MNLYSSTEMKNLLEKHDFFFKKNLGQNFLMNEGQAFRIASASYETTTANQKKLALEIGPGAGSLTLQLSKLFDHVIALEIDSHLISVLEESLSECNNVDVINTDALKFDYSKLKERFPDYEIAVCSNLPYYITSELIMTLLESGLTLSSVTVLIQKEACNRLISKPGTPDFGAITAVVSYYAKAEKLFLVGPGNFIPKPKVDSAVLRLIPHKEPSVITCDPKLMFRVIHAAFAARRKTLINSLTGALCDSYTKEELLAALEYANVDPARRGETLNLNEFSKIANALFETKDK